MRIYLDDDTDLILRQLKALYNELPPDLRTVKTLMAASDLIVEVTEYLSYIKMRMEKHEKNAGTNGDSGEIRIQSVFGSFRNEPALIRTNSDTTDRRIKILRDQSQVIQPKRVLPQNLVVQRATPPQPKAILLPPPPKHATSSIVTKVVPVTSLPSSTRPSLPGIQPLSNVAGTASMIRNPLTLVKTADVSKGVSKQKIVRPATSTSHGLICPPECDCPLSNDRVQFSDKYKADLIKHLCSKMKIQTRDSETCLTYNWIQEGILEGILGLTKRAEFFKFCRVVCQTNNEDNEEADSCIILQASLWPEPTRRGCIKVNGKLFSLPLVLVKVFRENFGEYPLNKLSLLSRHDCALSLGSVTLNHSLCINPHHYVYEMPLDRITTIHECVIRLKADAQGVRIVCVLCHNVYAHISKQTQPTATPMVVSMAANDLKKLMVQKSSSKKVPKQPVEKQTINNEQLLLKEEVVIPEVDIKEEDLESEEIPDPASSTFKRMEDEFESMLKSFEESVTEEEEQLSRSLKPASETSKNSLQNKATASTKATSATPKTSTTASRTTASAATAAPSVPPSTTLNKRTITLRTTSTKQPTASPDAISLLKPKSSSVERSPLILSPKAQTMATPVTLSKKSSAGTPTSGTPKSKTATASSSTSESNDQVSIFLIEPKEEPRDTHVETGLILNEDTKIQLIIQNTADTQIKDLDRLSRKRSLPSTDESSPNKSKRVSGCGDINDDKVVVVDEPQRFQCWKCLEWCATKELLASHDCLTTMTASAFVFVCNFCGLASNTIDLVRSHVMKCREFGLPSLELLKAFKSVSDHSNDVLLTNLVSDTKITGSPVSEMLSASRSKRHKKNDGCKCEECGVTFASNTELIIHMDKLKCKSIQCNVCDQFFANTRTHSNHNCTMAEKRKILADQDILVVKTDPEKLSQQPVKCLDCNTLLQSYKVLKHHQSVAVNCFKCSNAFSNSCQLLTHTCSNTSVKTPEVLSASPAPSTSSTSSSRAVDSPKVLSASLRAADSPKVSVISSRSSDSPKVSSGTASPRSVKGVSTPPILRASLRSKGQNLSESQDSPPKLTTPTRQNRSLTLAK